jgi:hypothetical protein
MELRDITDLSQLYGVAILSNDKIIGQIAPAKK